MLERRDRGILFVVSAPSGTGKSTLARRLLDGVASLVFSVSFTTRAQRPGETDGREYHFVTDAVFDRMVEGADFLEWAHVFGRRYGTKDVVQPQLERYIEQFRNAGITIDDRLSGIPDEEIISVVDVGLMAQVYANLFSNALKYTEEVIMHWEEKRKYMSYGHEVIREHFGPGKDGIKYNVLTPEDISRRKREARYSKKVIVALMQEPDREQDMG